MILFRVLRRIMLLPTLAFCLLGALELTADEPGTGPMSRLLGDTSERFTIGSRDRVRAPLYEPRDAPRNRFEQEIVGDLSGTDASMTLTMARMARRLGAVVGHSSDSLLRSGTPGRKVVRVEK